MKILIYSDLFLQKSGYAKEMRDILPYLKQNNEVAYVGLWYNGYPVIDDIKVYPTMGSEMSNGWAPEALQYAIEDFKPDIVLTNQDYFPLASIAFVMSHPYKCKWVHWGLCDGEGLDFEAREPVKWVHQHIFKTRFAKKQLRDVYKEIDGEILEPPLDNKVFYEMDKEALRKEYKLDTAKTVLCVARPQMRKNIPVLLEAMKKVIKEVPEAVLILAATHKPKSFDGNYDCHDIENFIVKFGLEDRVIIPRNKDKTPITDEVMNIQYNLADVNVLPSLGEGFGLTVTEAGACGVPTVGTACSSLNEVIADRGILIEPRAYLYSANGVKQAVLHPDDLAKGIINMLKNDKLREVTGKRAKEYALRLTPKSRAEALLRIFEATIKNDKKNLILK